MKTTPFRRVAALLLTITLLLGTLLVFSACADKGNPLLTLKGHTITTNQYRFLLSRVRGSLAYAGYSVDKATFWEMVVDKNNTTYDEYFKQAALNDARRYLAALALFDDEKLTLPASYKERIDKDMDEHLSDAGSKSALNAQLALYGVNAKMLREIYLMEAKYEYLQYHLYGKDGEKVAAEVRQSYLEDYAVCFRQVLIRAFDYVYETDTNGDDIYYLPSENNAKVNNIAYDTVKGSVRLDEYGKTLTDANGDDIFFLPDGKIAYDKVNGVRALSYDASGNPKTVKYSAEELAAHKADAEEILATVEAGDYAAFEALLAEYEAADDDAFVTDGTYCFLYTTGDNNYDYLNDIADTLAESEEGQIRMISSEYGYNVVMKYPMPADAAANTAYEDWFSDLSARTVAMLFNQKCSAYMEMVTVDEEAFATLPSMKDIGTNRAY